MQWNVNVKDQQLDAWVLAFMSVRGFQYKFWFRIYSYACMFYNEV